MTDTYFSWEGESTRCCGEDKAKIMVTTVVRKVCLSVQRDRINHYLNMQLEDFLLEGRGDEFWENGEVNRIYTYVAYNQQWNIDWDVHIFDGSI